jgi:hypothetical protein
VTSSAHQLVLEEHQADCMAGHLAYMGLKRIKRDILMETCCESAAGPKKDVKRLIHVQLN